MRNTAIIAVMALFSSFALAGCATLSASEKRIQTTPWKDAAEVNSAYEKVTEGKTTLEDLRNLGFDIYKVSRAEEWNEVRVRKYLLGDVPVYWMPEVKSGVPQKIMECAANTCRAYVFYFEYTQSVGGGNFINEWLKIEKERRITGSRFWMAFFFKTENGVVTLKLRDQQPFVDDKTVETNPAGFWERIFDAGKRIF